MIIKKVIGRTKKGKKMTYSIDFRKKVLEVREKEWLRLEEAGKRFGVGSASILRWTQEIEPRRKREKPVKIKEEELRKDVEKYADGYQYERAKRVGVSPRGIGVALERLGISCKKKPIGTRKQMVRNGKNSKKSCKPIKTQEEQ